MKKYLTDITCCQVNSLGKEYVFACREGQLVLKIYTPKILRFLYEFEGVEIPESQKEGSLLISGPANKMKTTFDFERDTFLLEKDDAFEVVCGDLSIVVEKKRVLVSIFKNQVLQHGGMLGSADTVVPDYQLRVLGREGACSTTGRFNFPLEDEDAFYGLGDKSGLCDRKGRFFRFFNRDSLGYDASNSDPLYKSIPFFIKRNVKKSTLCGLLFDQPLVNSMDFGRESQFYFSVVCEEGPYSYFYFDGDDYKQIINSYYEVTGRPLFPPLFTFGFLGSSMNYVEGDDAKARIEEFFDRVVTNDIPCEGMYVSSGYLKASDGKRYAFLWNKEKFPEPKKFIGDLAQRGFRLCMNLKPGILKTHPWYGQLARKGYFIKGKDGKPYVEFYWGGEASLIDFSNPEAKRWWQKELETQYLDLGCSGIWNDNNEFEMEDIEVEAYPVKSLLPILMCEASYEAFLAKEGTKRPWICSRSGYAGMQKYAMTWSGDNCSDWKTLRYNQHMGVSMGLSGIPFYGHDLGGFFGERPEEELLVRSCESAVLQPRFVIHSWREDGIPTEPWTYDSALPLIQKTIKEHYRFMPYIYTSAYNAVMQGFPMDRNLALEFPFDEEIEEGEINTLFGNDILKVLFVEKGVKSRTIHLPGTVAWYSGTEGNLYEGGTDLVVENELGNFCWFVQEGSVIPLSRKVGKLDTALFLDLELRVYPKRNGTKKSLYFEDDGITRLEEGKYNLYEFEVGSNCVVIRKTRSGVSGTNRVCTVTDCKERELYSFDPDSLTVGKELLIEF
ncbi:TIM-barrel domain-containing protein [uncultured Sphaerochaeta sp.]|uniref:glycoside hydrolase family 31 protein n=1 Tax=uncultured Sphaerochaeta sp. TaxID=886478 RepID=UPI002A0A4B13|nr:TIM-barrel domain-containing protein [uncultured Sphaerochaeta sp.]